MRLSRDDAWRKGREMNQEEKKIYVKWGLTLTGVVVLGILFFFFIYHFDKLTDFFGMILGILRAFVFGAAIAYIVLPLCKKLESLTGKLLGEKHKGAASAIAIILSLVIVVLIVLAVIFLIVPQLITSIMQIIEALPGQVQALEARITSMLEGMPELLEKWEEISAELTDFVNSFFGGGENSGTLRRLIDFLNGAAVHVLAILGLIKDLLLGLIVAVYLLSRRSQLGAQAVLVLWSIFKPAQAKWIQDETRYADKMFNGFFMGKLADSAIVGAICFVGCVAMGCESPLLIAVIVGVTNIIPFFGPFIGAVPSALLLLLENPMRCLIFILFVIVLQQVDGNIIGPKILGNTTGLSALWVMFAIFLFGGLWGIIGMIVGVPLMAVIYDIIRQLTYRGLHQKGMEEMIANYQDTFHSP